MSTGIRFAVLTSPSVRWEQMVERWQALKAVDFDSAWLPDHFVDLREPRTPRFEAWTLLPALARPVRTRLGYGASGEMDASYAMAGIDDWPFPQRVARFQEVVEIVSQARSGLRKRFPTARDLMVRASPAVQPKIRIVIGDKTVPMIPPASLALLSVGGLGLLGAQRRQNRRRTRV